jgi:hypothetical protein
MKNAGRGKVAKGFLFLHDNTPAHRALATRKKLAYLGSNVKFQDLVHLSSLNESVLRGHFRIDFSLLSTKRVRHRSWYTLLLKVKMVPVLTIKMYDELEVSIQVF